MVPPMARQENLDPIRGRVWLLAAALVLVALALLLLLRPLLMPHPETVAVHQAPSGSGAPAGDAPGGRTQRRAPDEDTRPARPVPRREVAPPPRQAAAGDVAPADRDPPAGDADTGGGEPSGIALFPPPGTNPPKPGLVVPDDFELPPGYVRHNQVTDDGTQLPPILMFHPDYEWVDASGKPITLPADHVVPPELAPPGMPLHTLEIPGTTIEAVEPPPPGAEFEPADPD